MASQSVFLVGHGTLQHPIESRFGVDGLGLARIGEGRLGDGDLEVLGHLVLVDDLAHLEADLGLAAQGAALALGGRGDARQATLGSGQQILALARALLGKDRVPTDHKSFPWIVRMGNLSQVFFIEKRHLDRPLLHKLANRGRTKSCDPFESLDGP